MDQKPLLPTDPKERKQIPIGTGVLDYFPAALAEVARVSYTGNEQHNPGQPLHHARGKSTDHYDTAQRHLLERGTIDTDGRRHTAKAAWRILAMLQEEMEAAGAPLARGARLPEPAVIPGLGIVGTQTVTAQPIPNLRLALDMADMQEAADRFKEGNN